MTIQNEYLQVEIAALGAELTRIVDRRTGEELLWEGDPTYWKRHSPILFPNVGKNYDNRLWVNGTAYRTSQHGFARDRVFDVLEAAGDRVVFRLCSDADTLACYPFAFELHVDYALEGPALRVCWTVKNPGAETMYFTIGGHPAFRFAPGTQKQDYCLTFPGRDALEYILLDPDTGAALPEDRYAIRLEDHRLPLSEALFARDALVFDGGQIEEVWLCRADGTPRVGMRCPGFPNYGVWSVKGAPFVCLEPWIGRCDDRGFAQDVSRKPGIVALPGQETFEAAYEIVLG